MYIMGKNIFLFSKWNKVPNCVISLIGMSLPPHQVIEGRLTM